MRENNHNQIALTVYQFFKIGLVTFGGGWAMVTVMEKEMVEKKRWMTHEEFTEVIALAQCGPGPIAINTAALSGLRVAGVSGALTACLAAALPSFLVIFCLAAPLIQTKDSRVISSILKGVRPAVVGLLFNATYRIGKRNLAVPADLMLCAGGLVLLAVFKVNPIFVIILAAMAGIIFSSLAHRFKRRPQEGSDGDVN